jgi:acyl-CoA oxidase|tara:strand:- start:236 stop:946 length:711 start_codon:yes stop_codon:yes gene_type:complete
MEMIGQRLFTGRVAVAQAALVFSKKLFANTKKYSDSKECAMRGDTPFLTDVPQLKALYDEASTRFSELETFVNAREASLCLSLTRGELPEYNLTRAIAVAKIKSVETCVELCHRLKQEVGSYALMANTGFEHTDFLQCCKFAEGDSRILGQKIARDAFAEFGKKRKNDLAALGWSSLETEACARVAASVAQAVANGASKMRAWDGAWRDVYLLADSVCDRVMSETFPENTNLSAKL